jgi:hypothetical protein
LDDLAGVDVVQEASDRKLPEVGRRAELPDLIPHRRDRIRRGEEADLTRVGPARVADRRANRVVAIRLSTPFQ